MNIKSRMLLMMAMSGMFLSSSTIPHFEEIEKEDVEKLKKRITEHKRTLLFKRGCQEYNFGEVSIIALNKKNAERKYQKYLKMKDNENRTI